MKFEDLPEPIRILIGNLEEFGESVVHSTLTCPECEKETVKRKVYKNQKNWQKLQWHVDFCESKNCQHWTCGWL